jgi:2,4-dienoyl-CoA reductase-like NADH-dependent reductase (Old Yellow Enzyme family)
MALKRAIEFCRSISSIRIGLQIAHSGRKGSAQRPWEGRNALEPAQGGWTTSAPSPIPLASAWPAPRALDRAGMDAVMKAFVDATKRAARIGFDLLELHSAHGYLLNSFLSPLANQRTDEFGGCIESRMRFPLQVFAAVRAAWPAERPLGAKIPGSDFVDGAWSPDDAVAYAQMLKSLGCDYVTVSGGGVVLDTKQPNTPGYQVSFAERVKRETGIATGAVGLINDPIQAEDIIAGGRADFVAMARAFLFNPRWPWHAAITLGAELRYPPQYERCHPNAWPGAAGSAIVGRRLS